MSGPQPASRLHLRRRRDDDLPVLARLLEEQQPTTEYPLRWPLPFPVRDFLVRPGEEAAWVAELDGEVVGHVAVATAVGVVAEAFLEAVGTVRFSTVSVLFVGLPATGHGVGGALLGHAAAYIRGTGRLPVLDVVSTHRRVVDLYLRHGWREVGTARPEWLPDDRPDVLLLALGTLDTEH